MTPSIALVVSDVDGTLITPDHQLTPRAIRAASELKKKGIGLTLASSRPPRGLESIVEILDITLPYAPFNGAQIVSPDGTVIGKQIIPPPVIRKLFSLAQEFGLNFWLYRDLEWIVWRMDEFVEQESETAGFSPRVESRLEDFFEDCPKLTLVGAPETVRHCAEKVHREMGGEVEASSSKPRFLDITVKNAHKGAVVTNLSRILHIPAEQIAAIGDGPNDIQMFARAGFSIAMGNGSEDVKKAAKWVTSSNQEEGFATGIEKYILDHLSTSGG